MAERCTSESHGQILCEIPDCAVELFPFLQAPFSAELFNPTLCQEGLQWRLYMGTCPLCLARGWGAVLGRFVGLVCVVCLCAPNTEHSRMDSSISFKVWWKAAGCSLPFSGEMAFIIISNITHFCLNSSLFLCLLPCMTRSEPEILNSRVL